MSRIDWKPEYSVGSPAVDAEHRELIDTINALTGRLGGGAQRSAIVEGLGEIYAQITAHFALEERMMRDARYGDFRAHKDDHELLLDQLSDMIDAVELGDDYDESALSSALDAWFAEHFATHDARLHDKL